MKLSDSLIGIEQLAFDTAPLIYFVERHPKYFDQMLFIMRQIDSGSIAGFASTMVLAEVLVQPLRTGNTSLAQRYEGILSDSRYFQLLPVTVSTARRAAALRARYNLKTPDALHVAAAIDANCDAILTNDAGIKRVTETSVLLLDELELDLPQT